MLGYCVNLAASKHVSQFLNHNINHNQSFKLPISYCYIFGNSRTYKNESVGSYMYYVKIQSSWLASNHCVIEGLHAIKIIFNNKLLKMLMVIFDVHLKPVPKYFLSV